MIHTTDRAECKGQSRGKEKTDESLTSEGLLNKKN